MGIYWFHNKFHIDNKVGEKEFIFDIYLSIYLIYTTLCIKDELNLEISAWNKVTESIEKVVKKERGLQKRKLITFSKSEWL